VRTDSVQPGGDHDAGEVAVEVHDGERALPGPDGEAADEILDREPPLDDLRAGRHDIGDTHAAERGRGLGGLPFRPGGGDDEPSDQHQPQAAEQAPQQFCRADADDARTEELPGPGRRALRPAAIAVVPPQHGPQHPAAIQRRAGQHVEHGEQAVHRGQPHQRGGNRRRAAGIPDGHGRSEEDGARRCTRGRPGQRDPQVRPGIGRLALEFGDPAEHPQRDRPHLDSVALRHQRVRHLMAEQRRQEQRRRRDRRRPVDHSTLVRSRTGQDTPAEQPGDEDQGDGDGPVGAHAYARHPAQRYVLPHQCSPPAGRPSRGAESTGPAAALP
jgi:hypothetical protein